MTKKSIGQFIAALRKANGMTQQEVADRLNVSNKAVSRWERDECAPDISVIPALAEMLGLTCDELLKGERILSTTDEAKKEPKVEKQIRYLINRTLSGFKTLIWISLAVSIAGLICMFGISYGLYRPIIAFAIMLLFESCACVITILAVSKTRDMKEFNELFEMAEKKLLTQFNNTLGNLSFISFFVILSVILLSLPFVLVTSDFVYSVISAHSYVTVFLGGIALILSLLYIKCKKPYVNYITNSNLPKKPNDPFANIRKSMTRLQIGAIIIASLLFVIAPYLEFSPTDEFSLFEACTVLGLLLLLSAVICFIVFMIKKKEERRHIILTGIRNIILIPAALIVSEAHSFGWSSSSPEDEWAVDTLERFDLWYAEYFLYAAAYSIIVFMVFALIEAIIKRKRESCIR